ncbi:helix-turn-helix domain-containing protein [Sphingomonas jejuensis]|uniref:helix-turn-helix domain-containing protein n=1 Tax=Sphingomonas jejuensis TaxID=904715 RepID=UPI003CC9103C
MSFTRVPADHAAPIGQLLSNLLPGRKSSRSGSVHRTGRPIHRSSKEEGTFEEAFFIAPTKGEPAQILSAGRAALDEANRLRAQVRAGERSLTAAERLLADLTAGTVRVLEAFCKFARCFNGRLFPSYERLATETRLGRRTVARALRILEALGLIVRQRRFKMVEQEDGVPGYRQTSNCYQLRLGEALRRFVPKWMRPSPPPADAIHHDREDTAATERMMKDATAVQSVAFHADATTPLGAVLLRMAQTIDDRECQNGTAPRSEIL